MTQWIPPWQTMAPPEIEAVIDLAVKADKAVTRIAQTFEDMLNKEGHPGAWMEWLTHASEDQQRYFWDRFFRSLPFLRYGSIPEQAEYRIFGSTLIKDFQDQIIKHLVEGQTIEGDEAWPREILELWPFIKITDYRSWDALPAERQQKIVDAIIDEYLDGHIKPQTQPPIQPQTQLPMVPIEEPIQLPLTLDDQAITIGRVITRKDMDRTVIRLQQQRAATVIPDDQGLTEPYTVPEEQPDKQEYRAPALLPEPDDPEQEEEVRIAVANFYRRRYWYAINQWVSVLTEEH